MTMEPDSGENSGSPTALVAGNLKRRLPEPSDSSSAVFSNNRPDSRPAYPRKRAARACLACRRRRVKCDNEQPTCGACLTLGMECVYREADRSSYDSASLAILHRLDTLETFLKTALPEPLSSFRLPAQNSSPSTATVPEATDSNKLNRPIQPELDTLGTSSSDPLSGRRCLDPHLSGNDFGGSSCDEGRPSPHVPGHLARDQPATYRATVETVLAWPILGCEVSQASAARKLRSLLQTAHSSADWHSGASPLLPRALTDHAFVDISDSLVQQFLRHTHIFNPVLEVSHIQASVKDLQNKGLGWDANTCLLLLTCALGSVAGSPGLDDFRQSTSFRQSSNFARGESLFNAAQARMGSLLCGKGIINAQVFFLAGVYLMITMRPLDAWRMFLQAMAFCQTFVPHADEESSLPQQHSHGDFENLPGGDLEESSWFHDYYEQRRSQPEQSESQLHKSIYWTCFKSELELRLELDITDAGPCNFQYPSYFPEPPASLQSHGEYAWYFYLAEAALRRLQNRILQATLQHHHSQILSPEYIAMVQDFEQQAESWSRSLPSALQIRQPPSSEDSPCPDLGRDRSIVDEHAALRFILEGHLIDCYEKMYWPSVSEAVAGRLQAAPATQAWAFVERGLRHCVQRIERNEAGFRYRHHGTWLMLRSCTRSAFVIMAAARAGLGTTLPTGWETSVRKVTVVLSYWKDEVMDAAHQLTILEQMLQDSRSMAVNIER